jgi:hypothetical protein
MLALLAAILGCSDAPPPSSAWTDPSEDDDWASLVPSGEHAPRWTADEVAAQFDVALASGVPLPGPVFAAYEELRTHGDGACPGDQFEGGFLVIGTCTSEEGYTYSGSAGITETDARVFADDGTWTGSYFRMTSPADYFIVRPDGTRLRAGGNLRQEATRSADRTTWSNAIAGTMIDEGADGWLRDGFSGALEIRGEEAYGGRFGTFEGSLTVSGVSLEFVAVQVQPDSCPDGLHGGTVRLRQDDATWYDIAFETGCGACGTLTWNETDALGKVCLDVSPLHAALSASANP